MEVLNETENPSAIITAMLGYFSTDWHRIVDWIPMHHRAVLERIDTLKPGLKGTAIRAVEVEIERLVSGGMLVLSGEKASGKTLAACVAGLLFSYGENPEPEHRVCFVSASRYLKSVFDGELDYAHHPGLLVIDDMGCEYFKDSGWGNACWDELVDTRYRHDWPLLITTNLTAQQFAAKYGERITSRIQEVGKWIKVKETGLRKPEGAK